ncbi:hypothetical protein JCM10914A_31650 [Paenibacillus sp. JCM 10914]|uniref:polysaccharide deacetylase family protein n=1 Tax=Paenibacillus sp. JCM 10914 TaxID=1236974 RepID=UPI0003CCAF30|nr:polysaccharide deacetylase family protein [Paenibacillus sp. JCM 10914]GAE07857.1 hypothetical protein JCM10914_4104 [Paenibacillus sp. JCM 10914]
MNIQHRKTAYLTFDDGPSEHTRIKLDYLQERGINAIWFCLGENLKQYTNEAVYAVQQGHVLGNHSYNHPKFSELGWQEAREQIERTDQWLQEVYSQAGVEWIVKTFRFPYLDDGSSNTDPDFFQNIQQLLRDKGYRQPSFEGIHYEWFREAGHDRAVDVRCTYDTMDWCLADGNEYEGYHDLPSVLRRMDENVPEAGRGLNDLGSNEIVMMHDWIPYDAFTALMDKLLSKGITFKLPRV